MRTNIQIANISFELSLDNDIASYFFKRVQKAEEITSATTDVRIICDKQKRLTFSNQKFIHQQEPDIGDLFLYREIFDLGIFQYNRKEKILEIYYMDTEQYPYNSFEVVVDTLLQFIYLIMLDFNIIPLHASVVMHEDSAILLFGNSGSGKTTLELSLLESGFQFFSDDIAFLDQNNTIFSSGEHIVACSKSTMDIIKSTFSVDYFYNTPEHMTGKHMIVVPDALICQYKEANPSVIIFPTLSEDGRESLERISAKTAWLELIQLSISKQFNSLQKQLYMKRLKALSESTIAFRYNRTNKSENMLKAICSKVRDLYSVQEVSMDD